MKNRLCSGRLAWLPIPGLLAVILVLWTVHLPGAHESQSLGLALNFVFSTLMSLFVASLIARSFLVRGTPGLLLLGCGVLFWGPAGVVATALGDGDPNTMIAIHNSCVWLAGLCHLAGVFLLLRPRRPLLPTTLWLPAAYTLAAGGVALVALWVRVGHPPTFFIQGQGGTPLRQIVLISAVVTFALTAVLLRLTSPRPVSGFAYWYSLALGLIAVGLFGVMLQSSAASILSWTGRAAQFLSGVYMLIAAVASVRETHAWQISLETALRGSEKHLRLALDAARMGTWDWDLTCDRLVWNDEQYRILGYDVGKVTPSYQAWVARVHPEDRAAVEAGIRTSMERCTDYMTEHQLVCPDGQVRWVEVRGRFEPDAGGKPVRSFGVVMDITERKRVEEELRRSEQRYRNLFAAMTEAFALHELITDDRGRPCDYRFLDVNPAFERLTGLQRTDLLGRRVLEVLPGTEPYWIESYGKVVLTGEPLHMENYSAPLGRWYEVFAYRSSPGRFAVVFSDITARKQVEESLRQSEENTRRRAEELAMLMDMTPAAVWVSNDPQCRVITGNRAAQRFYEATDGENLSAGPTAAEQDFTRRFFQDDRELKPEQLPMQRAAAEGIDVRGSELEVLLPSGRTITILGNASPLLDQDGYVRGSIAAFVDITARKRTEEALRQSEERFHAIFDHATIGIVLGDLEGRVLTANPAFARMLGYDPHEILRKKFDEFTHPDDVAAERELVRKVLAHDQDCYEIEKRYVRKNGSTVEVRLLGTTICGPEGEMMFGLALVEDITERKRAAEALRELNATLENKVAERTAELRQRTRQLQELALQLAQAEDQERRRIAVFLHEDLQQQIAGAKFQLSLLNGRSKEDPRQQAVIARIDETLRGAIEKSRSLSHELSPAVLHQNDMGEALRWLATQMRARHGLLVHVEGLPDVSLRSDALAVFLFRAAQEILLNVVKHAGVNEVAVRVGRRGRYIRLSVSDRGRGFDPKGLRGSTGFGLLSIRERSELLGGRMRIRSTQGRGSTLQVIVPDV